MHKSRFYGRIIFPIVFLLGWLFAFDCLGQQASDGYLELHGVLYKESDNSRVSSVKIKVSEGGTVIKNGFSRKGGRFRMDLPMGSVYTFEFQYAKHATMYMEVSTEVPENYLSWRTSTKVEIPLFEEGRTDVNLAAMEEMPFFRLVFNPQFKNFDPDPEHLKRFAALLAQPGTPSAGKDVATNTNVKPDQPPTKPKPAGDPNKHDPASGVGENTAANDSVRVYPEPAPPAPVAMPTHEAELAVRKREREQEIQQNKEIKQQHERQILELAEKSETGKVEAITPDMRPSGDGSAATEVVEHDTEIKEARSSMASEARAREQEKHENQAAKNDQQRMVLLAMAEDDKQRKIAEYQRSGDQAAYANVKPVVVQRVVEERFQTTEITLVKYPGEQITYRKVSYVWGQQYFYRNEDQLEQAIFDAELAKFLPLK